MPATESQNLREIDNITMPSSRKPVKAQEFQSREKSSKVQARSDIQIFDDSQDSKAGDS